jgi:hypothetical protein
VSDTNNVAPVRATVAASKLRSKSFFLIEAH